MTQSVSVSFPFILLDKPLILLCSMKVCLKINIMHCSRICLNVWGQKENQFSTRMLISKKIFLCGFSTFNIQVFTQKCYGNSVHSTINKCLSLTTFLLSSSNTNARLSSGNLKKKISYM